MKLAKNQEISGLTATLI